MATPWRGHFLVRLLRAGCLSVLLSLAAMGSVQAQEIEPGFANAARLGNLLVGGLSFGYMDDGTTTSYTGPTLGHCASSTPVTVFIGSYSPYLEASVNGSPRVSVSYSSWSSASVNANLNFGDNVLTVESFAPNGDTMRYDITVKRDAATSNADLGNLTISGGTLDSAFDSAITSYTASVSTDRITLTPTTADCSTVTVNGAVVTSGSPSSAISLSVGSNAIPVLVTAQDGTPKAYTVTVTRSMSADANLAGLSLSAGSLSPIFDSATFGYTASVAYSVSSVTVTSTPASSAATVTVNGAAAPNASASAAIALAVGDNAITVQATAEDGNSTKTYSVLVTRAPNNVNADLSALALSSASLSPAFAAATTGYSATVSYAATSIRLTPTATDSSATVKVNGMLIQNGNSVAVALKAGNNLIPVRVTGRDGETLKDYQINLTRAPRTVSLASNPSSFAPAGNVAPGSAGAYGDFPSIVVMGDFNGDGKLDLAVSDGNSAIISVMPGRGDVSFAASINTTLATSAGRPAAAMATGDFNGDGRLDLAVTDDSHSHVAILLGNGDGTFATPTIRTIAGLSQSLATGDFNGDGQLDLATANRDTGNVSILLGTGDGSFAARVDYGSISGAHSIAVGDFNGDGKADLGIAGTHSVSALFGHGDGSFGAQFDDVLGAGAITFDIAAGDFNNDGRDDLAVTGYDTSTPHTFVAVRLGQGDGRFSAPVRYETTRFVYPSKMTLADFNGDGEFDLAVLNENETVSTLQGGGDGSFAFVTSYDVGLAPKSIAVGDLTGDGKPDLAVANFSDASVSILRNTALDLAGLTLSSGSLSPGFVSTTNSYAALVDHGTTSITLTPWLAFGAATVQGDGGAVADGTLSAAIALGTGPTTITVLVTAPSGSAQTYTVTVTRASIDANLSLLALSTGSLSPAFASGTSAYTVSVANAVASLRVIPTASDAYASVTVNGAAVASASASDAIALSVSTNTLTVVVTAQDGSPTRTYTVEVTRAAGAGHLNNDTGQATCNEGNNPVACTPDNSGDAAATPRQDGRFGRDAAARARVLPKTGEGAAGFDYTRVCMSGELAGQGACPFRPARGSTPNDWVCTKDNVTQLTWSLPTSALYAWADATSTYPVALNAARHCGYTTGWRLPTRRELLSIVHSGERYPAIDSAYFPGMGLLYWSADTYVPIPAYAWIVDFGDGRTDHHDKRFNITALLVRSGL